MNLIAASPGWLVGIFIAALVAAAIEDAVRLRISNLTSAILALAALGAMVAAGPSLGLWQNVVLFALVLALGTAAFSAGVLGGGDVKLLAAAALWVDLRGALWLFGAILLSGGIVAIAYLVIAMARGRARGSARRRRVPYGIAIALGALIATATFRSPAQHRLPAYSPLLSQDGKVK